jgi:hypothetical protein
MTFGFPRPAEEIASRIRLSIVREGRQRPDALEKAAKK